MSHKPLEGIKIIDFTHVQAGPACTQMLAWFGADVIKVERPGSGDVTRSQLRDIPGADALYFTMLNSNKRSLTLDTKKPEGKAILEKMIKESDVMVENFGPGALDRMGLAQLEPMPASRAETQEPISPTNGASVATLLSASCGEISI